MSTKQVTYFIKKSPSITPDFINDAKDYDLYDDSNETEEQLLKGISIIAAKGGAFDFLKDEEDLYENIELRNRYQ